MKRMKLLSVLLVVVMLAGLAAGCGQKAPAAASGASYTAGTYTATADGNNGPVTVEVTVSDTAITSVKVTDQAETESIAGPAIERIPQAIVDNQSLAVDAVSGATVTSTAILTAVADAIEQAGGDVEALKNVAVSGGDAAQVGDKSADVVVIGAGGAGLCLSLIHI